MNASSYIHGDSFYHRFDVRPKLISTLLFAAIAFAMRSWAGLAAAFLLPLALLFVAVGTREAWRCLLRLLPLFAILVLFTPLQERGGTPLFEAGGFVIATEEGIWTVARIISRLGALSWALMLLLLTARNEEIIRGLRAFHMPYNAALAASMVLRFIPHLGLLFSEIRDSMSLRLDEGRRGYPMLPSITALTVAAIRMIPETAAALEERGFGRMAKMPNEPIPRPRGYSLQWLLGAIIPLSLLIVR